jgi:hypothetical protein
MKGSTSELGVAEPGVISLAGDGGVDVDAGALHPTSTAELNINSTRSVEEARPPGC